MIVKVKILISFLNIRLQNYERKLASPIFNNKTLNVYKLTEKGEIDFLKLV